jgi:hypothetical protein
MNDPLPEPDGLKWQGVSPTAQGEAATLTGLTWQPTPLEAVTLDKNSVASPTLTPKAKTLPAKGALKGTVSVNASAKATALAPPDETKALLKAYQQQVEQADLAYLWQQTVEHNPLIRYSVEKLALPEDLHQGHASRFIRNTLGIMISGAAIGASMLSAGGGAYQDMSIMAAGNAVDNLVRGKQQPLSNLTATEHLQLAELVDHLKLGIIDNYRTLVQSLDGLTDATQTVDLARESYADALAKGKPMPVVTEGLAYYQALLQESQWRDQASLARLQLARSTGPTPADRLQLSLLPLGGADAFTVEALMPSPVAVPKTTPGP